MNDQIEFYLPLGIYSDGQYQRKGKMHLTTTLDELNVQADEDVAINSRYRDINLLARVIDQIGDITDVTKETIMNLYEADFLYLQLLYKQINGDSAVNLTKCPFCSEDFQFSLSNLYEDISKIK